MPNIHHSLLIGSSVEKVYNAICSQEGLSEWWSPDAKARIELNSVARFHFGSHYFKEMKVVELKPNEFVKWNCVNGSAEWVGTNISFELLFGEKTTFLTSHPEMSGQIEQLSNDNATLVIFRHDNWNEYTLMFAECSYTWGQFLKSLKLLCETGKGSPWPNQHRIYITNETN